MAHPKKLVSTVSDKSSSKASKSSKKGIFYFVFWFYGLERQEVEDATIEVSFSTNNPVDMYWILEMDWFLEKVDRSSHQTSLTRRRFSVSNYFIWSLLAIDNNVIDELNEDLSESTCKRLVLVGKFECIRFTIRNGFSQDSGWRR